MRIETERLTITKFDLSMAESVHKNSLDEDNRRFVPDEVFETVEDAKETIEYLMNVYESGDGPLVYPVLLKDGTNVGYVQLVPIEEGYEIGYHIGGEYTRRGYATEAMKAFLSVVMEKQGIDKVYGICVSENVASQKVMEKCGFEKEYEGMGLYQGVNRSIVRYTYKRHTMKILVIGGTRFFGIHMVEELLKAGHEVTIATRGIAKDSYGERVGRIIIERTNEESVKNALKDKHFDVVIDKIAYCSNDIKYVMENVNCEKYIYMSSTSVYEPKHINTQESDFDVNKKEVVWCDRMAFPYDEIKRQAEYALWQKYSDRNWIAVRYPFAIGKDDYTKRLQFYVEHTMKSIPMHIDNLDYQMGFIRSDEAGKFIAFLVDKDFSGAINGSSEGTISLREIITYVEQKTGTKAVIDKNGDAAPYNGEPEYSINTDKAKELGYRFSKLHDWIYELLDYYIECGGCK